MSEVDTIAEMRKAAKRLLYHAKQAEKCDEAQLPDVVDSSEPRIAAKTSRDKTIIRTGHRVRHTRVANSLLQNSNLSYEARGLIADLLSRPDTWQISMAGTKALNDVGDKKMRRIFDEAIAAGYMARVFLRASNGRAEGIVYYVSDDPAELARILRGGKPWDEMTPEERQQEVLS